MNLEAARVVLRPRSLSDIIDLAIVWQRAIGGRLFLTLGAWVLLPSLALCVGARVGLGWGWTEVWLLAATLTVLLQGVFTAACGQLMFTSDVTPRTVFSRLRPRILAYLGGSLLTGLLLSIVGWTIVGFILLWPGLIFVREVVLLEGVSATGAIRRASRVARSDWSRTLSLGLLLLTVTAACILAFEQLGGAALTFVLQVGRPLGELGEGGSLSALIGLHLSVPLVATTRFLAYIDGRTRQDGWDIQVRFLALVKANESREAA